VKLVSILIFFSTLLSANLSSAEPRPSRCETLFIEKSVPALYPIEAIFDTSRVFPGRKPEKLFQGMTDHLIENVAFEKGEGAFGRPLFGDLILPDTEIRFYFRSPTRTVRLTVRRNSDLSWSMANTATQPNYSAHEVDRSGPRQKLFTHGEEVRLAQKLSEPSFGEKNSSDGLTSFPVERFLAQLKSIRYNMLLDAVFAKFSAEILERRKAIEEDVQDQKLLELFLLKRGFTFSVDHGLQKTTRALTAREVMLESAIQYLVDHKLSFWSHRIGAIGLATGIYKTGEVSASSLWQSPYDFEQSLFNALQTKGYGYSNGKWTPPPKSE
jgi:hypothetical protein